MPRIDLRQQVQSVLPRVFGGTDNEYGAASKWLLIYKQNDSDASIPVGTLVQLAGTSAGLMPTQTAGQTVSGVLVGRIGSSGKLEEAACAQEENAAIAVSGLVTVLTTGSATTGYYVSASNTDGKADVASTVVAGTFGQVIHPISSTKCVVLMGNGVVPTPTGAPSFATPAVVLGTAAAAGAASTVIRSDSTIVAFDATSPSTQAIGDAAATGSAAVASRRDHKHAMPAFGTGPAAVGTQANGSSANIARIDHVHATGAGTPSTQAFGDAASTGTGPAAAMTDHKHGMPNGVGAILIIDTPAGSPLVFADLVQNDDGDDLMYAERVGDEMGKFSLEKLFGMTIRESATDGSDFTNPDADYRRLFLGEDGILHLKDSAGTVTDIGGAGAVATDAIWDAAGDLVQGTGANTAARLAIGTAGKALVSTGSAVAWGSPGVAGTVVQVKTATSTTTDTTVTASMQDSSLSLAFTPLYSDSILHVNVDGYCGAQRVAGTIAQRHISVQIYNSTDAVVLTSEPRGYDLVATSAASGDNYFSIGLKGLYTVNSTSARTFKLRFQTNVVTNVNAVIYGAAGSPVVMTIMEVRP